MDLTVIGMISGTSYDAVDAAVADLSLAGDEIVCRPRGLYSEELPDELRARIAAALPPHATTLEEVCRLDTELGRLFGSVAAAANERLAGGAADLVVSHGQTVFHWVDGAHALGTLQLGGAASRHGSRAPTGENCNTRLMPAETRAVALWLKLTSDRHLASELALARRSL